MDEEAEELLQKKTFLAPETPEERFLADHLQQLLVAKETAVDAFGGMLFRRGDDLVVVSLLLEDIPVSEPSEKGRFLLEMAKRFGPPEIEAPGEYKGVVLILTGTHLSTDEDGARAYQELRESGIVVALQDFPGAVKTRIAVLGDGTSKVFLATVTEDERGIESFEPVVVGKISKGGGSFEDENEQRMWGSLLEQVDEMGATLGKGVR